MSFAQAQDLRTKRHQLQRAANVLRQNGFKLPELQQRLEELVRLEQTEVRDGMNTLIQNPHISDGEFVKFMGEKRRFFNGR